MFLVRTDGVVRCRGQMTGGALAACRTALACPPANAALPLPWNARACCRRRRRRATRRRLAAGAGGGAAACCHAEKKYYSAGALPTISAERWHSADCVRVSGIRRAGGKLRSAGVDVDAARAARRLISQQCDIPSACPLRAACMFSTCHCGLI